MTDNRKFTITMTGDQILMHISALGEAAESLRNDANSLKNYGPGIISHLKELRNLATQMESDARSLAMMLHPSAQSLPKTHIAVSEVRDLANGMLRNSQDDLTRERCGIMTMLESILANSGNYHGYRHIGKGIDKIEDDTRRQYS